MEVTYTNIGSTRLRVSNLGFGATALGGMPDTYGYDVSEDQARETLHGIFGSKVQFLDTSRNYGFGRSEERIGKVLKEIGGIPEGFVISTKLDRNMDTNDFDGERARRSLEESLSALGLDRLQLVHLHDPEYAKDLDQVRGDQGSLKALFQMKEEGLIEAVGLAAGKVEVMMELLKDWEFDAMITHNRYTLINRNANKLIDLANEKNITVLNAAPYSSGVLAKGSEACSRMVYMEASDEMLEPVKKIEHICKKYQIPIGAAALQFSMKSEKIASTICGISQPDQIQQTLDWAEYPISEEAWNELMGLEASDQDPEANRVYKPG